MRLPKSREILRLATSWSISGYACDKSGPGGGGGCVTVTVCIVLDSASSSAMVTVTGNVPAEAYTCTSENVWPLSVDWLGEEPSPQSTVAVQGSAPGSAKVPSTV